jgi:integrase
LKTVAKPLHKLPITAVTQEDIAALLKTVVKNSGDVSANRVRTTLSAFFAWLLGEGVRLPEGNPVSNTNVREEVPRDRVLSEAELKIIWNACRDDDYGNVIKLLILTGQRRGEIAGLLWDEVNDDQLVLSAHRVKNKRAHVVPISAPAKAIIANVRIFGVGRKHVFGREDNGFQGWTLAKRGLEKRLARSVPDWTVHDIRRSVATHMAEKLGVQPHIIEAVLNHISGSTSGIASMYNRAAYDYRKREALDNWGAYVTAIVTGATANVWSQKRA